MTLVIFTQDGPLIEVEVVNPTALAIRGGAPVRVVCDRYRWDGEMNSIVFYVGDREMGRIGPIQGYHEEGKAAIDGE